MINITPKGVARATLAAALAIAALALAACTGTREASEKVPAEEVWGYVASAEAAQLEVAPDQPGASTLVVSRVLSPDPAWIVVHADDNGAPGERFGLAHVDAGETRDVSVSIEGVPTDKVFVAIHADKGEPDVFDFDMMNKEMSPDRPYFVDRKELAAVVTVR